MGNNSYFPRFVDTWDAVLVNHHSWELAKGQPLGVDDDTTCMAPLKVAAWDEEGTLRLRWWEGNSKAKGNRLHVEPKLIDTAFDAGETLILEGVMALTSSPTGLYLQGVGEKGTAFLVHATGLVEYGDIQHDSVGFEKKGYVDRELSFDDEASFRLIRRGRITEFYLNDYLMQSYCLPERCTGRIGLIGGEQDFHGLKAWYAK